MKKGELSMSMIIMAVIAIIILVIIIFLVTRSGGDANKATSCPSRGGVCVEYGNCEPSGLIDAVCPANGQGQPKSCCDPTKMI